MDPRQMTLIMYIIFGFVLALIAIPLMLRRIKPNPWYGFRVPKTMNNPEIWYEINAYSGRWFFVTGLVSAVMAAVMYALPSLDTASTSVIQAVVVFVLLGVGIGASFNKLSKM